MGTLHNQALAQAELELRKQIASHDRYDHSMIETAEGPVPAWIAYGAQYARAVALAYAEETLDPTAVDPWERIEDVKRYLPRLIPRLFKEHFRVLAIDWEWDEHSGQWVFRDLLDRKPSDNFRLVLALGDACERAIANPRDPLVNDLPRLPQTIDLAVFGAHVCTYGSPLLLQDEIEAAIARYWQRIAARQPETIDELRVLPPQNPTAPPVPQSVIYGDRLDDWCRALSEGAKERMEDATAKDVERLDLAAQSLRRQLATMLDPSIVGHPEQRNGAGISDKIRNLRKRAGWSQLTLAKKTGLSRDSIVDHENGHTDPSAETLSLYRDAFNKQLKLRLNANLDEHST